jgi:RNA polymerase-interacting CarD/CdnL/TRCF family regulator
MQFKIGDRVIHPVHGPGQIVNVKEKEFSDKKTRLYYEVALPKRVTLWVPVETEKAGKLRLETVRSELNQPSDLSKIAPVSLNTNPQQPLHLTTWNWRNAGIFGRTWAEWILFGRASG